MAKKKSIASLFTIRKRKKAKHPYVIVGASRTKFDAMSITHEEKKKRKRKGYHNNFELINNPNPNDNRKAFLRKQVIKDYKFNFGKAFQNYAISKEDQERIESFVKDKKKK